MNDRVRKMMHHTDYKRVENCVAPFGMPDANWYNGWCELKTIEEWPKRADTVLCIKDFSLVQRRWLKRRCQLGRAFLLLHCGGDWLLFWGEDAAKYLGLVPKAQLFLYAIESSQGTLNEEKFRACLLYFSPRN